MDYEAGNRALRPERGPESGATMRPGGELPDPGGWWECVEEAMAGVVL